MNTVNQKQIILGLLKQYPQGINRAWVTDKFQIMDVPTRISELKDDGYSIGKKTEKNRTATYFLIKDKKTSSKSIVEPTKTRYIFKGNTAIQISEEEYQGMNKPRQESFI